MVVAGLAMAAHGQANVVMEVAPSGQSPQIWGSTLTATPGSQIDVRVRVSYNGGAQPLGLSSLYFQPTVSNWRTTGGTDTFGALVNGGQGGNTTSPIGAVTDAPGQYGRIIPFASRATNGIQMLTGFIQSISSVNYLRIAQQYGNDWIGTGLNISGGRGVPISQLAADGAGRTTADPAFNAATQNVIVFKFKITLSTDQVNRTMVVDAPAAGFGNLNSTTGVREVRWFATTSQNTGSIVGAATVSTATITEIPTPGAAGLLAAGGLAAFRRRRR